MNRSGYMLETRSGLNAIATLNVDLERLTKGLSLRGIVSFESRGRNRNTALKGFVTYKFDRKPTAVKVDGNDYIINLPDGLTTASGDNYIARFIPSTATMKRMTRFR